MIYKLIILATILLTCITEYASSLFGTTLGLWGGVLAMAVWQLWFQITMRNVYLRTRERLSPENLNKGK